MHLKVHISSIFGLFKYTLQLLHHTLPFSVIPSQSNLSLHLNTSTSSLSFLRNCCFISKYMTLRTELLLLSHFSRVRLCATPETAAHQAPLSLGFSRQEHWSGLPFPSPNLQLEPLTNTSPFFISIIFHFNNVISGIMYKVFWYQLLESA